MTLLSPSAASNRGTADSIPLPLLDQTRQLELLVQSVIDYAIYMLDATGRIVTWNTGGQRIKGYAPEEVLGRHFSMFYTPEDAANGEPEHALLTAAETGRYEREGWRVRKDGTRFWAHVVVDPVWADGHLIGFAKVTRDITERRQAQQALEEAQRAFMQSQKMEAIGQLTYGLAHDFNNLLTVIANSLDRILGERDIERIRRSAEAAQRAADRGALLTRQLLAFSRGQWLKPKAHDINALIQATEAVLRRACDETIEVEFALGRDLPQVSIDAPQFEAALLNLVINARDAMPDGGRLRIETRCDSREDGEEVVVAIVDTGVGMTPDVASRAAEPFFTTKEIGQGSGLGLSQVYGFATQSGGRIDIQSAPGRGTTVALHLPALRSETRAAKQARMRILMVDDDLTIREVVEESLREAGFDVLTAGTGAEAVALLQQHRDIDLLFADVVMPGGMSGVALAKQALTERPDLRIVLASGYSESWLEGIPEGCRFVAKPYRVADLLGIFREMRAAA
ncbi:PAS domain S-box-containing protein [Vulcaniibacterium tengchongense]|uniref:histidine kinase n=2 Tax=Vulcaniibacterium tengchongense TaxID=1273429 RepID=A0A3N4VNY5_9GAMM|nr:PAS domain S-box-containing protein [Vulcaniibacterium tengchongense]